MCPDLYGAFWGIDFDAAALLLQKSTRSTSFLEEELAFR
jgi:hypothetical protein